MSYAAFKIAHAPTGVGACATAFLTHSPSSSSSSSGRNNEHANLVIVKANVLEIYNVRVQEGDERSGKGEALVGSAMVAFPASAKRGGHMSGITAAWLELVVQERLHGVVESMVILSGRDGTRRRRDAITLAFRDAKFSVLYFDDATQKLKTSSMHFFEGPEWVHLKRGRETFPRGPLVRADAQGKCAAALIYKCQLVLLNAAQDGYVLGEKEEGSSGTDCARIESSHILNLLDMEMMHIKDFVFLNGYTEPVILVLHEREPTWAGRVSYRRETCSISAYSVNTNTKKYPRLWERSGLSYDAYGLLAVPSAIGGVLVLCANSILYCNPGYTFMLALNEFATPPPPGASMEKAKFSVELDAAHATWLSNSVALISAKTGMLLLLYLVFDGRNVRLELVKSRASVLSSSICTIGNSFFFLGSRLGDSLLVQFTGSLGTDASDREYDEIDGDVMAPASKRLRIGEDADDFSFYRYAENINFGFTVRDSLVNIGPLRDITTSASNNELVACSGHGKNGCISILSRSLRPEFIAQVELLGCKDVWTVYHRTGQANLLEASMPIDDKEEYHAFLIISLASRTMVLEAGEMLGEITDAVQYYTQGPTISAGNMFGRRRVAQVYQKGVRILDGTIQTQDFLVAEDVIVAATIADPYILLRMSDGSVQLVTGDSDNFTIFATTPAAFSRSDDAITSCTLYHDKGWLRKTSGDVVWQVPDPNFVFDQVDIYCIVCRASGKLEFYELPSMTCMYRAEKFTYGLPVLVDHRVGTTGLDASSTVDASDDGTEEIRDRLSKLKVSEVYIETWGEKYGRPFLFALLSDGTLLCYRAFCYEAAEATSEANSGTPRTAFLKNLRLVKMQLDLEVGEEDLSESSCVQKIICFKDVGGLQGIFLAGVKPMWLMMFREQIRAHPQASDLPVAAFTSLHISNCKHGFIYVTSQGALQICRLPEYLNYDSDWPVQKMQLRGTPHQIAYHTEANLYALVVSSTVTQPASLILPSATDLAGGALVEQSDPADVGGAPNMVTFDEFEVRILNPSSAWETKATLKMQPGENVLTLRIVNIKQSGSDQTHNLLAIGTGFAQGEDVAARGRIILVALGADPNEPNVWARELYSKEQKGAISAVAPLQGHLLIAIGPKIYLHTWDGNELTGTAFYDAPLYVVSLNIVKNFVLFGDFHKSIYFLCWKEEGAQLVLLAKDYESLDCYTTEFLIDGSTLSLLVSDSRKNIQVFSYSPKSVESFKGPKLLPKVEFHLGSHVAKFIRLQMLSSSSAQRSSRFALCFGTLDGGVGYVAPLDELTFRRLHTLQRKLVEAVPHTGGLNPKAFRQLYSGGQHHRTGPDNAVDCEQLRHYEAMPLDQQMLIARQIGTTRQQILANMRDLSQSTSFF